MDELNSIWISPQTGQGPLGTEDFVIKNRDLGNSLVVQWLRPHTSTEGRHGFSLFGELRSCECSMAQPRNKQNKKPTKQQQEKSRHLNISPRGWGAAPASRLIQIPHLCLYIIFVPSSKGCFVISKMEQNFLTGGQAGVSVHTHTHTHPSLDHLISLPPTTRGRSCHNVWGVWPLQLAPKGGAFLWVGSAWG